MPTSTAKPAAPAPRQLFRHVDGGIYRFLLRAQHSDDRTPLHVYEHVWPYAPEEPWARPVSEWATRFTPITEADLKDAEATDRLEAQLAIARAKAARRAKEGR